MPEVIFNGPEGRLEGRYHHSKLTNAPIAILLHPHPELRKRQDQHLDGLPHLGRQREPLLLTRADPQLGSGSGPGAHCQSKSSPR